jgi:hypothetical protein
MKDYTIEEWNYLTLEERVEAAYKYYYTEWERLKSTQEEIDMNDYMCISAITGTLANIRGSHGHPI